MPNDRFRPSPWTTALVIGMPSTYMSVVKSWPPITLPQRPIDWTPGMMNMKAVGSRGPPVFITSGSAEYTSLRIVWPSRASAVASGGASAVTSTSCVMLPTCSVAFRPTTPSAVDDDAVARERLEAVERDRDAILAGLQRHQREHAGVGRLSTRLDAGRGVGGGHRGARHGSAGCVEHGALNRAAASNLRAGRTME